MQASEAGPQWRGGGELRFVAHFRIWHIYLCRCSQPGEYFDIPDSIKKIMIIIKVLFLENSWIMDALDVNDEETAADSKTKNYCVVNSCCGNVDGVLF